MHAALVDDDRGRGHVQTGSNYCCLYCALQELDPTTFGDFKEAWEETMKKAMGQQYWQVGQ